MRFILLAVETTAAAAFFNSESFLSLSSDEILSNVREVTITVERYERYSVLRLLSFCSSFEDSDCFRGDSFDDEDDFDTISDALLDDMIFLSCLVMIEALNPALAERLEKLLQAAMMYHRGALESSNRYQLIAMRAISNSDVDVAVDVA